MKVYGSPRPNALKDDWRERWQYFRQACGFLLWRIGLKL